MGHEVTLFASGDSVSAATLVPGVDQALRLNPVSDNPMVPHLLMLEDVFSREGQFDLVHSHVDALCYPFARRSGIPVLSTLHGRLDLESLDSLYQEYREQWVVSISDSQREALPDARWIGTVHHGLPRDLYRFHPEPGRYLAFIGRVSPEKRLDRAIEIATRCHLPLRIAAKVDPVDLEYFHEVIEPMLHHPLVAWIGELSDQSKDDFLGNALALLFPIDWPEPFGLTMIESLACGTPVVAWQHGSVSEIIEPGVTGCLCEDVGAAVRAVHRIRQLSRAACRESFERRFTARRMAEDYLALYRRVVTGGQSLPELKEAVL